MKNANNPYYPMRNHHAILAEFKSQEAKRKAAKATMAKKAVLYRKVIQNSFFIACLANIASMGLILVHLLNGTQLFTPITVVVAILMTISLLVSSATFVAKKIWEHKLFKLGLLPPD